MNKRVLWIPLSLLVLAALACGGGGGGPTALYRDSFGSSSSGWCVDSDDTSSLDYSGGKYVFEINDTEWFVWCNPEESFENIHLEVVAENPGGTSDTVFGLMCHYQSTSDDFYYVGITSSGDYTIRLYTGGEDDILAEGISDDITTDAASYTLGMDCGGGGEIALYVDGVLIDSASDDRYTSGDIGLFSWTGDDVPAEIHFDDLVVTAYGDEAEAE
jgi:hypothetical protein